LTLNGVRYDSGDGLGCPMRILALKGFEVTSEELLLYHFGELPVKPGMVTRYELALKDANGLLDPVIGWQSLSPHDVEEMMERVQRASADTFELLRPLKRYRGGAYLAYCTIGSRLEAEMERNCQHQEIARAYIIDAVGSVAVAKLAKLLCSRLSREAAREQWRIGPPIMPGTRDVNLKLQRILFDLGDAKPLGVRLTERDTMVPLKSMSMIVGFGQRVRWMGRAVHDCKCCPKKDTCSLKRVWKTPRDVNLQGSVGEAVRSVDYVEMDAGGLD
jgi:hypothetical protein